MNPSIRLPIRNLGRKPIVYPGAFSSSSTPLHSKREASIYMSVLQAPPSVSSSMREAAATPEVPAPRPSISLQPCADAIPRLFPDDPDCSSFSQLLAMAQDCEDAPEGKGSMQQSALSDLFPSVFQGVAMVSKQQNPEDVMHQTAWPHYHSVPMTLGASEIQSVSSIRSAIPVNSLDAKVSEPGLIDCYNLEERSNSTSYYIDKPCDDGYNWRKYGQKQMKGSEYPRSYYKCTYQGCPVKKNVERSHDGQITEIIYKGCHNHEQPSFIRRSKDTSLLPNNSTEFLDVIDTVSQSRNVSGGAYEILYDRNQGPSQAIFNFSDGDDVGAEVRTDAWEDKEPDKKRSRTAEVGEKRPILSQKTLAEPKIVVQTKSEVDLLDDGYRWRKYGQKVVKGSSHPRSYYKCTFVGCNVRKHIERASADSKSVITTYEGKHNHDVPLTRNSSHAMAATGATNVTDEGVHSATSQSSCLV